ncbi:hypothetical protein FB451DRAFT_1041224 [Mycena latifolia]|nr:hypothetical protein FB451DRAFT_1041224 [Mycena latifolia]
MRPTFWQSLSGQLAKQPPVVKGDLTGKTVCVLGANTGIGFQTCKHFASMNPERIILACRSSARGQAAVDKLKAETGYSKAELWLVDLANFDSVKRFGDQFEKDGGRLDILVANAAMETPKYTTTKDGWETTLQVNHLGTSFAVLLLLPTILKTAKEHATLPRIVLVSSALHYAVTIDQKARSHPGQIFQTLSSAEYCTPKQMRAQYSVTKLLNVFFARALNAHLGPSAPIIVNAVTPGFTVSELRRDISGIIAVLLKLLEWMAAFTTEEGSRRLVWAAVGLPDAADTLRGEYINCCVVEEASDFVVGAEGQKVQQALWDETIAILGKLDPRIDTTVLRYLSA